MDTVKKFINNLCVEFNNDNPIKSQEGKWK